MHASCFQDLLVSYPWWKCWGPPCYEIPQLIKITKTGYALDMKTGSKLLHKFKNTSTSFFDQSVHANIQLQFLWSRIILWHFLIIKWHFLIFQWPNLICGAMTNCPRIIPWASFKYKTIILNTAIQNSRNSHTFNLNIESTIKK